jgi:hypothetical protein
MVLTASEKDELLRFCRPLSRSVEIAKSFRGEAPAAVDSPDKKAADDLQPLQGKEADDLFASLDLEEFDDKTKQTLEKIKQQATGIQKLYMDLDVNKRQIQSRADKAEAELRQIKAGAQQAQKSVQERMTDKFEALLIKKGFKPEVARAQAELQSEMMAMHGEEFKQELGVALNPTFVSLGNMQADRALDSVMQTDKTGAFEIKEVNDAINQSIQLAVQNNQTVNEAFVKNVKNMHWGEYIAEHPDALTQRQQQTNVQHQQTQPSRFAPRTMRSGSSPFVPQMQQNGGPGNLDSDTEKALIATFGVMATDTIKPPVMKGKR